MTERPVLHMTCVPTYESRAWCTTGNRWGIGRTQWQQADQVSRMCQSLFIMCTHSMDCWLTEELPISWQISWCVFQKSWVLGLARSGKDLWNWRGWTVGRLELGDLRICILSKLSEQVRQAKAMAPKSKLLFIGRGLKRDVRRWDARHANLFEDWSLGLIIYLSSWLFSFLDLVWSGLVRIDQVCFVLSPSNPNLIGSKPRSRLIQSNLRPTCHDTMHACSMHEYVGAQVMVVHYNTINRIWDNIKLSTTQCNAKLCDEMICHSERQSMMQSHTVEYTAARIPSESLS